MADTTALIELKKVVDRFVFKYKLPDEDFINYFEHAADCVRELSIHAISSYKDVPLTTTALGILTMPTDMLSLIGVALAYKGQMWYFTEDQYMIIRTDADDQMPTDYDSTWASYGVTGAKNLFYFRVDWSERLIYIDGAESTEVRLQYLSSGLNLSAATTVPAIANPAIDAYLRLMQGEIDGKSINEQLKRRRTYEDEFRLLKLQSLPALREIRDYFLSMTTQAIQR
jgi:hypothetical protein